MYFCILTWAAQFVNAMTPELQGSGARLQTMLLNIDMSVFSRKKSAWPGLTFLPYFQQWRLIPYVAAAYVLHHFSVTFHMSFVELQVGLMTGDKSERQVGEGRLRCGDQEITSDFWQYKDVILPVHV